MPSGDASRIARIWVSNSTSRRSPSRRPRTPSAGFASVPVGSKPAGLSPPTSSVRNVTGRSPIASAIRRYTARCSASPGATVRPRNSSSVRTRPIPSAPRRAASSASAIEPTLASTRIPWRFGAELPEAPAAPCAGSAARSSAAGSTTSRPPSPSRSAAHSSRSRRRLAPMPRTRGIPSARATMAA